MIERTKSRTWNSSFLLLLLIGVASIPSWGKDASLHYDRGPWLVPTDARVSISVNKEEIFLGQNVLLHFTLENVGIKPFRISTGGDYRGGTREARFRVKAIDASGRVMPDPDPLQSNMGGLSSAPEIKPGQKLHFSVPLNRYCLIDLPGVYKITVQHDFGWKEDNLHKIPSAAITLKLLAPNTTEAGRLLDAMYAMPRNPDRRWGEKTPPYPDFSTIRFPAYLPSLMKRARQKDTEAVIGIGSIATPEGTQALVNLVGDHPAPFLQEVLRALAKHIPAPQLDQNLGWRLPWYAGWGDIRNDIARKAWSPEFSNELRSRIWKLNTTAIGEKSFLIQCLLEPGDQRPLIDELNTALKGRDAQSDDYPKPVSPIEEWQKTAMVYVAKGFPVSETPGSPGEVVLFLTALQHRKDFRPVGWEKQCHQWLNHNIPYVRELTLRAIPRPCPPEFASDIKRLLSDPHLAIRVEACQLAWSNKMPGLGEAILKMLENTKNHWLVNAAACAAVKQGVGWKCMQILAKRLDDPNAEERLEVFRQLTGLVIESSGSGSNGYPTAEEMTQIKAKWLAFLDQHKDRLSRGERFKIGDPEITSDLIPSVFQFHTANNQPWPKRGEY